MSTPRASDDVIAVLPMPPGGCLAREQAQRITCLAITLGLVRGRNVHINAVRSIAEWLYSGAPHHED